MEPRYKGPVIIYVEVGEGKRRGVKAISDWLEVGGGGLKTTVMSAVNKREPINGIALHHSLKPPAHIGKI